MRTERGNLELRSIPPKASVSAGTGVSSDVMQEQCARKDRDRKPRIHATVNVPRIERTEGGEEHKVETLEGKHCGVE
jgi:hypothetical protein